MPLLEKNGQKPRRVLLVKANYMTVTSIKIRMVINAT